MSTSTLPDLSDMHDGTLEQIVVYWQRAIVQIIVNLGGAWEGRWVIEGQDFRTMQCPHASPWGGSVSINGIQTSTPGPDWVRMELEVQSGDVVVLEAKNILIRVYHQGDVGRHS